MNQQQHDDTAQPVAGKDAPAATATPIEPRLDPTVQATHYVVSCLPEDHDDHFTYSVQVEYRHNGQWAITHWGKQLGADGSWSWGFNWDGDAPEPATQAEMDDYDQRQAAWVAGHRFDFDTAVRLAKAAVLALAVAGSAA